MAAQGSGAMNAALLLMERLLLVITPMETRRGRMMDIPGHCSDRDMHGTIGWWKSIFQRRLFQLPRTSLIYMKQLLCSHGQTRFQVFRMRTRQMSGDFYILKHRGPKAMARYMPQ